MTKFIQLTPECASRMFRGKRFTVGKTKEQILADSEFARGIQNSKNQSCGMIYGENQCAFGLNPNNY